LILFKKLKRNIVANIDIMQQCCNKKFAYFKKHRKNHYLFHASKPILTNT